jgi:hypothetical protein
MKILIWTHLVDLATQVGCSKRLNYWINTSNQICNFLKYLSIDYLLIEIGRYNQNIYKGFKYHMEVKK